MSRSGRPINHRHRTLPLAAALVFVGALSGGGLVWARGTAAEISACVEPRTGYLVYGRSCGGASIAWSQEGPVGPQGPAGQQGATGPPGATGRGIEPPSAAVIKLRNQPPKGLKAVPGKPNLAQVAKLKPSLGAGGVWAFASFHDQDIHFKSLETAFTPKGIAHLDVPAGKYVVFAKAYAHSYGNVYQGWLVCSLVAGTDSDTSASIGTNSQALTVVHAFAVPARIAFRCAGIETLLRHVKITAIRVDGLKNTYVEAG